jgi:hypothetical protein
MTRAVLTLRSDIDRQRAANWAHKAPSGTIVEFRESKRSLDQNSKLWSMLTDVARQVDWYGEKLTPDDWKDIFTASLKKARVVPGIDGGSFVVLGLHTSSLTKQEFGDLLELINAFAAERSVAFADDVV